MALMSLSPSARSNVTVKAAEDVTATISVSRDNTFKISASTGVTLNNIKFISSDGTSIIYMGGGDNLVLDGCSFINGRIEAGGMALYIHYPNITISNCEFKNWERGYYTCRDNSSAGAMNFTGNTFDNVRVPIDGYWGRYATDSTNIKITGNKFTAGSWDAAYIQLWDYAQYGHYCNGGTTGTAINATVSNNNFVDGKGVLYLTHFDWFAKSNITVGENNGMKTVRRHLVELTGETTGVTLKNTDGTPITAFNENTAATDRGPGKKAIYAISEGKYLLSSTKDGVTQDFPISVKQPEDSSESKTQTYEVKAPKAAKVGETEYNTLQAAIDAAKDGDTVTLLGNVTEGDGVVVQSGKNITIDFAGHTYTVTKKLAGSSGTETQWLPTVKGCNCCHEKWTDCSK